MLRTAFNHKNLNDQKMKSVCVFCGSSAGRDPLFSEMAVKMGENLAGRGARLIYGGGSVGLMGIIADAVLAAGGEAIGVIPRFLWEKEVGHKSLSKMHIVDTMHERKAKMAELADAFVAMPGGLGTLEEIFEIWTWAQLGVHAKPIGFLNVSGYYDPLLQALDSMVEKGLLHPLHRAMALSFDDPETLLDSFADWRVPEVDKWWEQSKM